MGPSPRGRRMPAGLSPVAAKFRGASGHGLSGSGLRQQADLAVAGGREPSGSPAGKPNASAQAVVRCAQAGSSSLHILRESGAACHWLL